MTGSVTVGEEVWRGKDKIKLGKGRRAKKSKDKERHEEQLWQGEEVAV